MKETEEQRDEKMGAVEMRLAIRHAHFLELGPSTTHWPWFWQVEALKWTSRESGAFWEFRCRTQRDEGLRRVGRRSTASAFVNEVWTSHGPYFAVNDG
jgi:hypothetical protein